MNKRTVLLCLFFLIVLLILLIIAKCTAPPEPEVPMIKEELPEIKNPIIEEVFETSTDIVEVETTATDIVEEFTTPTEIVENVTTPTDTTETDIKIEEPEPEIIEPIIVENPEPEPVVVPKIESPKKKEPQFVFYASVSPYALQFVNYKDYKDRISESGFGLDIGSLFSFTKRLSCGLSLSCERYVFPNFHKFNDFKANLISKFKALNINDKFESSLIFDLGADFVLRDDSDFGTYPLVGLGLEIKIKLSEKLSAFLDTKCQLTLQKGSVVYHLVPHLGMVMKGNRDGT